MKFMEMERKERMRKGFKVMEGGGWVIDEKVDEGFE